MLKLKATWDTFSNEEKICFSVIFSNLFHYSLSILGLFFLFGYLIYTKKIQILYKKSKYFKLITFLLISNVFISLAYHNNVGAAFTLIAWIMYVINTHIKSIINKHKMLFVLETICKISIFTALYIIIGFFINYFVFPFNVGDYSKILFLNENYGAAIFSFVIITSIYLYVETKHKIYLIVMFLNIILIILSNSRGALLGIILTFILIAILFNFHLIKKYYLIIAISFVTLFIITILLIYLNVIHIEKLYRFIPYRIPIWNTGLHAFLEHPILGQGSFSYTNYCREFGTLCIIHSHSIYLETLMTFGVVGTSIIMFLCVRYYDILKYVKKFDFNRYVLIIAIITVTALHGLIDCQILWIQSGSLFMFYLFLAQITNN